MGRPPSRGALVMVVAVVVVMVVGVLEILGVVVGVAC
jgi:hypothetical protein